jgi:hypothetical protein
MIVVLKEKETLKTKLTMQHVKARRMVIYQLVDQNKLPRKSGRWFELL